MARRSQTVDAVGSIVQLAGFVVIIGLFISLFFPAVRRAFAALGFIAVCLLILAIAGLTGRGIHRLTTKAGRMKTLTDNPFSPPTKTTETLDETWADEPETTLDLPYPVLRRRYPWRP